MDTKHIKISDYNYDLPDERIAKFPISQRDHSKLLVYKHGEVSDDVFFHLPDYLPKGAMMVFNNTKVIQARMHFRKETGALIEVFLMEPAAPTDYELMFQTSGHCSWLCMIGNLKKWKEGSLKRDFEIKGHQLTLSATMRRGDALSVEASEMVAKGGGTNYWVDFDWDNEHVSFAEILEVVGELPIPPYLNRKTEESDKTTYQTVYSKIKGSVAAPTAGLHFTDEVLQDLDAHGIDREEVTLHVNNRRATTSRLSATTKSCSRMVPLPRFTTISAMPTIVQTISPRRCSTMNVPACSRLEMRTSTSISSLHAARPSTRLLR